ncbi:autophagy protein [Maudiozyma humilis]|uniref:Autophagy-related protein 9 n=1 Tax=Maudiozyma humilis TaxID=51915 RepID=A0AAV5RV41_MAUHU|nr:autophagy protein [Kazachstania humilis]
MDNRDEPRTPSSGKNAFLSRIFGLQSDDVSHSIQDEEMGNYPRTRSSTGIRQVNGQMDSTDEDGRIPESDQETSSEDESGFQLNGTQQDTEEMSDVNLVSSYHNSNDNNNSMGFPGAESIKKIGQLSSDEEVSDGSGAPDDESVGDDVPLFGVETNQYNKPIPGHESPSIGMHASMADKPSHIRLDESNNNIPRRYTPRSQQRQNAKRSNSNNMKKSFLVDDYGTRPDDDNRRRTTILPNISLLNRNASYRTNNLNPTEAALWKWANVENLDVFLQDVYDYYLENGFSCIMLKKILNLLTLVFVVWISTFMGYCIDYSNLTQGNRFSDIRIQQCYATQITGVVKLLLWIFYVFVLLKIIQLYFDYKKLKDMHNFYTYLLNISDDDLQTVPWQTVIKQLMFLKDQNALTANVVEVKAKNRLNAHDVANRIMRKNNYLIAMYNNDIFDFSLPFLSFDSNMLTKTLEWNINLCVIGYAFNDAGFVKQGFLKVSQRDFMIEELQKRFMLAGFLNILLSPFLVVYFVLLYFFRYFNEYKNSPGSIGARQYTPIAEWKFREYNELYHIFRKRVELSYKLSNKYVEQFPKEKTNIIMKFIAFIAGSFVSVLALVTILDPENFLNFEITKDKTVIFYITILGTIWSICNGTVLEGYNTFDPEEVLLELSTYTHYLPEEWKDKYHTESVKQEFCKLYSLRILTLLKELASMILTPFILWFSLPKSASNIVDFFRESSVYVDSLGYVCKYAMFDINTVEQSTLKPGAAPAGGRSITSENITNRNMSIIGEESIAGMHENVALNKMMQSYMYFIDDYENNDNITGKYQVSNKKTSNTSRKNGLHRDYSWKKQFQPGRNPNVFAISKDNDTSNGGKQPHRRSFTSPNGEGSSMKSFYIPGGSGSLKQYPEMDKSTGVLNLVKDYYRKADIGR